MQRALKRSELPVWYSEGFNPRIYLNFPLALSLGVEGTREPMDFYIVEDISFEEIVSRLNGELPEGLCAVGAAAPVHLNKEIGFAEYTLTYSGSMADVKAALDSFMAQEKIEVEKRSKKKGMITVDIKPYVEIKGVSEGDSVYVDIRLPAGLELNLNAAILPTHLRLTVPKIALRQSLYVQNAQIYCVQMVLRLNNRTKFYL